MLSTLEIFLEVHSLLLSHASYKAPLTFRGVCIHPPWHCREMKMFMERFCKAARPRACELGYATNNLLTLWQVNYFSFLVNITYRAALGSQ